MKIICKVAGALTKLRHCYTEEFGGVWETQSDNCWSDTMEGGDQTKDTVMNEFSDGSNDWTITTHALKILRNGFHLS